MKVKICPATGATVKEMPVKTREDFVRSIISETQNPHLDTETFVAEKVQQLGQLERLNHKKAQVKGGLKTIGVFILWHSPVLLTYMGGYWMGSRKTPPPQNPKPAISRPAIPPPPAP